MSIQACQMADKAGSEELNTPVIQKIRTKALDQIMVCAHRAYHQQAPENSLAAIRTSMELGIDIIEIDVRTTADDSLVLMHDATIDRTTNGSGAVEDLSFAELQRFNLLFGDSLTHEKIPTLTEALALTKGQEIIVNLDLKAADYKKLYDKVKSFGMEHEVISFIEGEEAVQKMKAIDPEYATLPLAIRAGQVDGYAKMIRSPLIHLKETTFTEEILKVAATNGQLTFINSLKAIDKAFFASDMGPIDRMIAMKPAIIQTDYPVLLIEYLRSRGLHD